jgi:RND family efflux transporter MFP subunit
MSLKKTSSKILLPLIILLIGFGIMALLIISRKEPKKEIKEDLGALVNVSAAEMQDYSITVHGTGTVRASQEVSLIPQVSGEIVYVASSMTAGGFFREGDLLFEIDDTDYRFALEHVKASMAKAQLNLSTVESKARIARMEWERIRNNNDTTPNPLVLYEPQLQSARAELSSASAAVQQAELNLERTRMRAPFNCRVRSEDIDFGQYVRAGSPVGLIAGTDVAEIVVPLPLDELTWLNVPGPGTERQGSSATVRMSVDGRDYEWKGRVVRSVGEIDPKSRMIDIVLEVRDPYGLSGERNAKIVLSIGAFVEISMRGTTLTDVFPVSRKAVRGDSTVWVMGEDNLLTIKKVQIVRSEREFALISEGIKDGDRIVLTTLTGVANGMKLRVEEEGIAK